MNALTECSSTVHSSQDRSLVTVELAFYALRSRPKLHKPRLQHGRSIAGTDGTSLRGSTSGAFSDTRSATATEAIVAVSRQPDYTALIMAQ